MDLRDDTALTSLRLRLLHALLGRCNSIAIESLRLRLLDAGYAPVPASGKQPVIARYPSYAATPPSEMAIRAWTRNRPKARNTGIVCGLVRVIDLDIDDPQLSADCQRVVENLLGTDIPCRVGRSPRVAYFAQSDDPARPTIRRLGLPRGGFEIFGLGRHVVVDGIHPDTGKPYVWRSKALWEIPSKSLPVLTAAQEDQIVRGISAILGGSESILPPPKVSPAATIRPAPRSVPVGQRNNSLFPQIKNAAITCATEDDLLQRAKRLNVSQCDEPLPEVQLRAMVRWAWDKKQRNQLWLEGGQARVVFTASECNTLDPDSLWLLATLRVAHGAKRGATFAIAAASMSKTSPMGEKRIRRAVTRLKGLGLLEQVGARGSLRRPTQYRLLP